MNTESHQKIPWVPASGFQLRKAGVQFDAVRVDGDPGRQLADLMEDITGGEPGPIVMEANGRRSVYFLVVPGSTGHRAWPAGVTRLTAGPGLVCYIPVPALNGATWPLSWRCPPTAEHRFGHALLLYYALAALRSPRSAACDR
ncbi:hypothetical protein NLX86_07245 [Streptomyces sp. A3M-1-3]|uniref:hypothetical protein n=1 Tax=Streptomyces sp. A3M-1-3 TaxID=2962044 RepID=UPI0020B68AE8|nr:hypothetical protein [Streptomyces sp. A3M-1-3]MCP3817935.1 hypothetical protein [Streptomyces sp. A3M-1-3]